MKMKNNKYTKLRDFVEYLNGEPDNPIYSDVMVLFDITNAVVDQLCRYIEYARVDCIEMMRFHLQRILAADIAEVYITVVYIWKNHPAFFSSFGNDRLVILHKSTFLENAKKFIRNPTLLTDRLLTERVADMSEQDIMINNFMTECITFLANVDYREINTPEKCRDTILPKIDTFIKKVNS